MTAPSKSAPVETKVSAAALVALLASIGVAVLNAVLADSTLLGGLPPVVQMLILAGVPPIVVFLGGYAAPHTRR